MQGIETNGFKMQPVIWLGKLLLLFFTGRIQRARLVKSTILGH